LWTALLLSALGATDAAALQAAASEAKCNVLLFAAQAIARRATPSS
jgi:hypothetical protein